MCMANKLKPLIALSVFILNCGSLALADQNNTINTGIYTKEQAKEGAALYKANCLICHDKKYFKPVLKTWRGRTLGQLYETMSTTMPETNPAGLPRQNYVDILAYILSLSKYSSGDKKLDFRAKALDNIIIAPRNKRQ